MVALRMAAEQPGSQNSDRIGRIQPCEAGETRPVKASGPSQYDSESRSPAGIGAIVDQRLRNLMEELGEAINNSLSDSEQIAEVITRIKAGGYDVFLLLEATVGFNERDDASQSAAVDDKRSSADFSVTPQDVRFLKSLHIRVDQQK